MDAPTQQNISTYTHFTTIPIHKLSLKFKIVFLAQATTVLLISHPFSVHTSGVLMRYRQRLIKLMHTTTI